MADLDKVVEQLSKLTVIEAAELAKKLETAWGVSAVAVAPVAAAAVEESKDIEKTNFTIILSAVGEKKINVIKEVRAVTNLGLKDAKDLVDNAPKPIKEDVPKEEAQEIKKKLEAAGATVELS